MGNIHRAAPSGGGAIEMESSIFSRSFKASGLRQPCPIQNWRPIATTLRSGRFWTRQPLSIACMCECFWTTREKRSSTSSHSLRRTYKASSTFRWHCIDLGNVMVHPRHHRIFACSTAGRFAAFSDSAKAIGHRINRLSSDSGRSSKACNTGQRSSLTTRSSYGSFGQFLAYLEQRHTAIGAVCKADADGFIEVRLELFRKRHNHDPVDMIGWRSQFSGPIRSLFRMLAVPWQVERAPATPWEQLTQTLCQGYCQCLTEVRGLSMHTFRKNGAIAKELLTWMGQQNEHPSLLQLSASTIDQFLPWRLPSLRRATRLGVCSAMRCFLRNLHAAKYLRNDLSAFITEPSHYRFEEIPRSFTQDQVDTVLACTRKDRTGNRPARLRDAAVASHLWNAKR